MSWHFLQEREAVSSADICWDGGAFAPSKSTTMLGGYCLPDSATACSPTSQSGTTLQRSTDTHGAGELMLSAADSPARISAQPEKEQASPEHDQGFGLTWPASSARYDRATASWKIHPCLFPEDSMLCSVTLPRWGTMRDGELSERTTPELLTSGIGSGFGVNWPTPKAAEERAMLYTQETSYRHWLEGRQVSLGQVMRDPRMWPTPQAADVYERKNPNYIKHRLEIGAPITLQMEILRQRLWPTPTVACATGGQTSRSGDRKGELLLAGAVKLWSTPTTQDAENNGGAAQMERNSFPLNAQVGGALNPVWVEWLMWWPLGWTDLKPLAMAKFRQWQHSHGGCSHD